jgi:hypothetical protein
MWLFFVPLMRSPSQCPGIARSSISAGRSRIEMASMTYAQTVGDEKRNAGEKVASLVLKEGRVA